MSLAINVHAVTRVLLPDGWHSVNRDSFDLDSYEFVDGDSPDDLDLLRGGASPPVPSTGFKFLEGDAFIIGPLTSILAVVEGMSLPERG